MLDTTLATFPFYRRSAAGSGGGPYEFQAGRFKNLGLLLQANNLHNQPYQTMQGSPFSSGAYAPERYTTYGRQILLGLNYNL